MAEPWLHLAHRAAARRSTVLGPPSSSPPRVAGPPAQASFFTRGARGRTPPAVWYRSAQGLQLWRGAPVGPDLGRRFGVDRVASWPLRAERVEGRLFVLDKKGFEKDHLLLGEIVARRIAGELDQFYMTQQLRSG